MEHQIQEQNDRVIVSLTGEVDLENSPKARKILLEAVETGNPVVVDLAGVTYMDSSGIASLVEAFQRAKKKNLKFVLACVNPAVLRVLNLARLDKVFTIVDTLDQGLKANG